YGSFRDNFTKLGNEIVEDINKIAKQIEEYRSKTLKEQEKPKESSKSAEKLIEEKELVINDE
ncbi:MAG: hypothetical protein DRO98_08735, partial [Archaeoglobales archaeon]